jgi:hypothetical protein
LSSSVALKRFPHVLPHDRYLQIRYEEFVSDLSRFAGLIFDFLGVPLSKVTLAKISDLLTQEGPSRWEKDMPDHLRRKVSGCLNTTLKELGYNGRS